MKRRTLIASLAGAGAMLASASVQEVQDMADDYDRRADRACDRAQEVKEAANAAAAAVAGRPGRLDEITGEREALREKINDCDLLEPVE